MICYFLVERRGIRQGKRYKMAMIIIFDIIEFRASSPFPG
jgi:hypothetical protein